MCRLDTKRSASILRRAFTLVEAVLLIAVLMILAGMLIPAVRKMREANARSACQHNLRRIAVAAFQFHDAQARFPAGETVLNNTMLGPWNEEYYSSWVMPLLPYLGEKERAAGLARYSEFDDRHQGGKSSLYGTPIPVLVCPSDALPPGGVYEYHSADPASPTYNPTFPDGRYDAVSSYGANWGTQIFENNPAQKVDKNGMFHYNTRTRVADVLDGLGNTILFGERSHEEPRWRFMGYTNAAQQNIAVFARWYTGGVCTGRQPVETINFKLPAWVETNPPAFRSVPWNDLHNKRLGSYGSEHPGGCNFVMADGSVRFLSESITLTTLRALSTKAGGELLVAR
jgi:prepilin-type processing-associated H-X9-DG protein